MDEIMSDAVRKALNDPVKRFRLLDAYLARKAEELDAGSKPTAERAAAPDERPSQRRRPRPRPRSK